MTDLNLWHYFINELHHNISTRRLTRGLRPGEPAFYESRSFYDADGQLVRRRFFGEDRLHSSWAHRSRTGLGPSG